MKHHYLKAGAEACHWGFFDATRGPLLTVNSGDRVTVAWICQFAPARSRDFRSIT